MKTLTASAVFMLATLPAAAQEVKDIATGAVYT